MNPFGIVLAYILFGYMAGIGTYLAWHGLIGVRKREAFQLSFIPSIPARNLKELGAVLLNLAMLVIGLLMVYGGLSFAYIVAYR